MLNKFILISPARNEAKYLLSLIESVASQQIRPRRWAIVNDASTDDTGAIIENACKQHSFIVGVTNQSTGARSFGSKSLAFRAGQNALGDLSYDFIGNLDADVTFEPGYYERMLLEMDRNPKLGVASGACWDKTPDGFKKVTISLNHAVGAVQFFRRECFDEIGGYRPASVGGVDSLATLTARMKGWQTRVIDDLPFYHHKPVDSANARSASAISYRAGLTEYHIGTHPLFAIAKAIRRWNDRPVLMSPFIRLYAYGKLWLSGVKRDAPDELVAYLKNEQLRALFGPLLGQKSQR